MAGEVVIDTEALDRAVRRTDSLMNAARRFGADDPFTVTMARVLRPPITERYHQETAHDLLDRLEPR